MTNALTKKTRCNEIETVQVECHLLINPVNCASIADVQSPSFGVTCPASSFFAYTERSRFSAQVNWTEPVATDNSGVPPAVTSNYQPPQRLSQGIHVIIYTAVDQSGNTATCDFTVKVVGKRILACIVKFIYSYLVSA